MKRFLLLLTLLGTTACVNGIADVNPQEYSANDAFLVLDTDINFDGKEHALCDLSNAMNVAPAGMERVAFESDPRLMIMKVQPGKYALGNVTCHAYKVMWNKVRVKNISPPLLVNITAGTITYPGTVVGTWDSEGMAAKDLFNGGGTWTEDEGSLVLKREDRTNEIYQWIARENPNWLGRYKFTTVTFETSDSIIQ